MRARIKRRFCTLRVGQFRKLLLPISLHHSTPPSDYSCSQPLALYLCHHKAESDGWNHPRGCTMRASDRRSDFPPSPTIANPPTLAYVSYVDDSPLPRCLRRQQTVPIHIQSETVPVETRYYVQSLVYAVASKRIPPHHLLPPTFPNIRIMYSSDQTRLRRHYHCPGVGKWRGTNSVTYNSPATAIAELVKYKDLFWCEFCLKPLFFPPRCRLHASNAIDW